MISGPVAFSHVNHAENSDEIENILGSPDAMDFESDDKHTPLENIKATITKLFAFRTRTARKMALHRELSSLSHEEQVDLKQEYLLRESVVVKKKAERMSVADFDMLKVLGHGGFGVVRLVREKATGEVMAMKSLTKQVTIERGQEGHVKSERSLLSIASELGDWIVRLFYSFQDRDYLYFVLEYMPGGDLLGLLIKKDIFEESFARFYFAEIVLAIEEVHKMGMIHRDIKPDNFLFDAQGHLKLADFGLATDTRTSVTSQPPCSPLAEQETGSTEFLSRKHTAYSVVGTNNYVAPEVLRGHGYDKACDWWSAGVILFEMVYGYPAFSSNTATATKKKILDHTKYLHCPSQPPTTLYVQDLIKGLICNPEDRLGATILPTPSKDHRSLVKAMMGEGDAVDIKRHEWFQDFDWEHIQTATPPFVPQLQNKADTAYFDEIDPHQIEGMLRIDHDPAEASSLPDTNFDGFTYLSPGVLANVKEDL
ncbi:hypothetical protein HDV03_003356 [Kappamyces sp. JEL0829]|nr:hypothetical protein HDV03_003356 [Kappamyces sp. JEL0829]